MKEFFKDIKSDKAIVPAFFINGIFIIVSIVYILFSYANLPPFIPIFNQLPWGEQRLGDTFTIFIPVLVALLILIINIFTSAFIYKKTPLVARMLVAVSLLISTITFLFIIKTVTLML